MEAMECPLCRGPENGIIDSSGRIEIDCPQCGHLTFEQCALQRLMTHETWLIKVFAARARQIPRGSQLVIAVRAAQSRGGRLGQERVVGSVVAFN